MVIFITGATHTGKTNLAQRMLEKFKYPYVSQDHIKMGLIRSHYTKLTPEDDDQMTDYLWPITREMAKTAIENNQNLIIEGCYIPFAWKKDFDEVYLKNIRYICLCMSDHYINRHFDDIKNFASCIEKRLDDTDYTLELIKRDNRMYREGCAGHNLEYILIEEHYQNAIERCLRCEFETCS